MLLKIIIIALVITIGFVVSITNLGSGGFLFTFLVAFGLFCVIGLVAMAVLMKKRKGK